MSPITGLYNLPGPTNITPPVTPYGPPAPDSPLAPPIKGETPYTGEKVNFIQRLMRGLGQRRINQIVGGLGARTGQQDMYGTWVNGPDPFQAGIEGSTGAGQRYDASQTADAQLLERSIMDARRTKAMEQTAQAATDRAAAYGRWADRPSNTPMTPGQRDQDRLNWFNNLTPEQQRAARVAGIIPQEPYHGGAQSIQAKIAGIKGLMPDITDPEAQFLASSHPSYIGSRSVGNIDPKTFATTNNTTRVMALPAAAVHILAKYGKTPEDFFALDQGGAPASSAGGQFHEGTPQSQDEVDQIDNPNDLAGWLQMATNGQLTEAQTQWVYDRYDELRQMIDDGEIPDPDEEDQGQGAMTPENSNRRGRYSYQP